MIITKETSRSEAEKFLDVASQFKLGKLITETQHPDTLELSGLAKNNIPKALEIIRAIDLNIFDVLIDNLDSIQQLSNSILKTISSNNKVFIYGCGSTGRLALTLEVLWRETYHHSKWKNSIVGFMTGGDLAMINSIEDFEDHPEYGARHLEDLNFGKHDLLISVTEGGETPSVIGATEKALQISLQSPFFLYCNPDNLLCEVAERSKNIILNRRVNKINLTCSPMVLTGSTRMQASTILMAAIGIALFHRNQTKNTYRKIIKHFTSFYQSFDLGFIEKFTLHESDIYKRNEYIFYETDEQYGVTVLTDTTERSPTFSLAPFENNQIHTETPSLCYLYLPKANNSCNAWQLLLHRKPRTLEWNDINGKASYKKLLGFDFSRNCVSYRNFITRHSQHHKFKIKHYKNGIYLYFSEKKYIPCKPIPSLFRHILLKMVLNTHSTLVMGQLNRYESNIMTWVRSSNNKLMDRTIRNITYLLNQNNISCSYKNIAHTCFALKKDLLPEESLVLKCVDHIKKSLQ